MPESTEDAYLRDNREPGSPEDARRAVTYLVARESDEYVAIMSVLEGSARDLTPAEVASALREGGAVPDQAVVESRLSQLKDWGAVSARSDQTHVRRVQDLLLRNFRYTATRQGRQVQRFYETVLSGSPVMREIPMQSLNAVVLALESIAGADEKRGDDWLRTRSHTAPRPSALWLRRRGRSWCRLPRPAR
jgi:hypothetical protein